MFIIDNKITVMKYIQISIQNKLVTSAKCLSATCQTIIAVDGSELWKSMLFRWILPPSEYAVRVKGTGKGSCAFKNIRIISFHI